MSIQLDELQDRVAIWAKRNFGARRKSYQRLLGATEELGELCHAHVKEEQGIRDGLDKLKTFQKKCDAIADIIICLTDYAHLEGISVQGCIDETWPVVEKRDWKKDPIKGGE